MTLSNVEFTKKNPVIWLQLLTNLFHQQNSIPERAEWDKIQEIHDTLKYIASYRATTNYNLPKIGSVTVDNVVYSREENCLELHSESNIFIVRPEKLMFQSFKGHPEWNYFLLQTSPMIPVTPKEFMRDDIEDVYEFGGGGYISHFDNDFDKSCQDFRPVVRGAARTFCITPKSTPFYTVGPGDFGKYNELNEAAYKQLIESLIDKAV